MQAAGRIIPRKVLTSVQKRGKGFSARQRMPGASFPPFWIFCRSGHVSIIESLASTATDEFQLVAGWPVSRGPRMGFPGFCTSSFHGATRSFAFRPYLLPPSHSLCLLSLSLFLPVSLVRSRYFPSRSFFSAASLWPLLFSLNQPSYPRGSLLC